jgi:nucleotide-binding universal stress UspA family protein
LRDVPLTIVHVLPSVEDAMWVDLPVSGEFWEMRERGAADIVNDAMSVASRAMSSAPRIPVRHHVLKGGIVPNLVDMSKDADLVAVGCRGLGTVQGLLLGSVSSGLVHHAHGPVAVIHDENPLLDRTPTAPVAVGVDGSQASESAVAIAFDEASRRRVGVVAIHAWSDRSYDVPGLNWTDVHVEAEGVLAVRLGGWSCRYPDVAVERVVAENRPVNQLLAQSESAQLLVVGSHGRGGFAGLLLVSVGSAVAHAARIPVIVARPR